MRFITPKPTTSTIQFANAAPVPVDDEDILAFIQGEIAPRIADKYVSAGMPRRGLITFNLTIYEQGTIRLVGPSLCRRAWTSSSAVRKA